MQLGQFEASAAEIVAILTCTRPFGACLSRPPSTSTERSALSSASMENAASPANACSGVSTTDAPWSASARVLSRERFQTRTVCPALSALLAIAPPISPSPMNPMSILACSLTLFARRALEAARPERQ